mgnify:CR=1 FL=1
MNSNEPLAFRMKPKTLEDYVGQEHVLAKDKILYRTIKADRLSSIILFGPPGCGKTSLARVISETTKYKFYKINAVTAGVADIKKVIEETKNFMLNPTGKSILFIDEIHRINRSVEEILYPAMEDYALDIIIGKGPSARSLRIDLEKFTLIGATTRTGQLTGPLRDRFGIMLSLELYSIENLQKIITRSAGILGIEIEPEGALEIARRSRGTPRIANRLLKRVRDFAQVKRNGKIDLQTSKDGLDILEVDSLGLDTIDRKIITTIIDNFSGGPVGIDTIAASTGEERITIEDVYEPYLLQKGLIKRTPRGRIATAEAYRHLNIEQDYE